MVERGFIVYFQFAFNRGIFRNIQSTVDFRILQCRLSFCYGHAMVERSVIRYIQFTAYRRAARNAQVTVHVRSLQVRDAFRHF